MSEQELDDLAVTEKLFAFLQGIDLDGCTIPPDHVPRLTPDQAWTAIWYLQNLYWNPADNIERCDVCGDLYDCHNSGDCLDFGDLPYFFCDACICTEAHSEKAKIGRKIEKRERKKLKGTTP